MADGQIPISVILTSASLHDSQVAIPLSTMSTQRVTYLYELSDSAYDAREITENSREHNHVPITDPNNRGRSQSAIAPGAPKRELSPAEAEHYKERTMIERVNARLAICSPKVPAAHPYEKGLPQFHAGFCKSFTSNSFIFSPSPQSLTAITPESPHARLIPS